MKARTKITVTLAVGIGLLVGSMGTASAKPHITTWVKAPVTSFEEIKVTFTEIRVPEVKEKASPVSLDLQKVLGLKNVLVTSFESGPVRPLAVR